MSTALTSFCVLFSLLFSNYDTDVIVDKRDGQEYKIIKIDNVWWFQQDLAYESEDCFCKNRKRKKAACQNGNFYGINELESICPNGWHVATESEWKQFHKHLLQIRGIDFDELKIDTLGAPNYTVLLDDTSNRLNMMGQDTPLKLTKSGWVQGWRHVKMKSGNYWAPRPSQNDQRSHIHMNNERFYNHTHDHHVVDHKFRQRRFRVRCTCEADSFNP